MTTYCLKVLLLLALAVDPVPALFCRAAPFWQYCLAPNRVTADFNIKRVTYMVTVNDAHEPGGNKYVCCFAICCYHDSGCGIHWPFFNPVCGIHSLEIHYCNAWELDYQPGILCYSNWNNPPTVSWDYSFDYN